MQIPDILVAYKERYSAGDRNEREIRQAQYINLSLSSNSVQKEEMSKDFLGVIGNIQQDWTCQVDYLCARGMYGRPALSKGGALSL